MTYNTCFMQEIMQIYTEYKFHFGAEEFHL